MLYVPTDQLDNVKNILEEEMLFQRLTDLEVKNGKILKKE